MTKIYENEFKREHSIYLRKIFNINPNGVDYHNPNNLGFEFKESFMKDKSDIQFKIPKDQIKNTDFFIFSIHSTEYFIVDKREIQERYSFKTYGQRANIRINTVKKMAIFNTINIREMKEYIDNLNKEDLK